MNTTNKSTILTSIVYKLSSTVSPVKLRLALTSKTQWDVGNYRLSSELSFLFSKLSSNMLFHSLVSICRSIMDDCVEYMSDRVLTIEQYYGIDRSAPGALAAFICNESPFRFLDGLENSLANPKSISPSFKLMALYYIDNGGSFYILVSMFIEWYCIIFDIDSEKRNKFYADAIKVINNEWID